MDKTNGNDTSIDLNQLITEREAAIQRLQTEARERQTEAERFIGELRLLVALRDGGYTVSGSARSATMNAGPNAGPNGAVDEATAEQFVPG